ncbi:TPA: putative minor capsid protein [Streptococcus suis]
MIDKRLLVDSVTVKKVVGLDEFGKESYAEPFHLQPVRFDRDVDIRGGRNHNPNVSKPGVIFNYPAHTGIKVDESWLHAKINDGTRDYEVVGYKVHPNPYDRRIFSYEIEVI